MALAGLGLLLGLDCSTTGAAERPVATQPERTGNAPSEQSASESERALRLRTIVVADDGRVLPMALGEHEGTVVLLSSGPRGLIRHELVPGASVMVDGSTTLHPADRSPEVSVHDPEGDRIWFVLPELRMQWPYAGPREGLPPPVGTVSYRVIDDAGMAVGLRVCPMPPSEGPLGSAGSPWCDHQLVTARGHGGGLLVAGSLAIANGRAAGWVGWLESDGTVQWHGTVEASDQVPIDTVSQLLVGGGAPWALGWFDSGGGHHAYLVPIGEDGPRAARSLGVASWAHRPWVGWAPDGDRLWLVLPEKPGTAVLLALTAEGEIEARHEIEVDPTMREALALLTVREQGLVLTLAERTIGSGLPRIQVLDLDRKGTVRERLGAQLPERGYPHAVTSWQGQAVFAVRIGTERLVLSVLDRP